MNMKAGDPLSTGSSRNPAGKKNEKFGGATFLQKDGVLLKLFEKSFTKNFFMVSGCFPVVFQLFSGSAR
ncbi:hypothetical protein [Komagataeibacter swingsii]|uniref:Uncharacterized protein n=1 Tax=Komagataeibacter swingsii TaxID=215220 RepID=A0A850P4S6_9PROT|nr:hypothetical protein [Komagataeibacter swingsii]NVN36752.1 hypothetical protein [Komagataeibacter swingsii]